MIDAIAEQKLLYFSFFGAFHEVGGNSGIAREGSWGPMSSIRKSKVHTYKKLPPHENFWLRP